MGWRIDTWERASADAPSQDALLVMPDPARRRLRVAVLDGVTPTERCRGVAGVDGAMYAAAIAHLALRHPGRTLDRCLAAANEHLHDPAVMRSRDQRQTCVTAAEIYPDGRVDVVRAGDCDAWVGTDSGWRPLGTGSALTPAASARWDAWRAEHRTADRRTRHRAEELYLGGAEAWTATALGRFERPAMQRFTARDVSELVLASDGARLSADVLDDLPAWLGQLREWERHRDELAFSAGKVHDDVTVMRLQRLPIAIAPGHGAWPHRSHRPRAVGGAGERRAA